MGKELLRPSAASGGMDVKNKKQNKNNKVKMQLFQYMQFSRKQIFLLKLCT